MQVETEISVVPTGSAPAAVATPEPVRGDQSLLDDIRLLGRLLGDTVREQEGVEA